MPGHYWHALSELLIVATLSVRQALAIRLCVHPFSCCKTSPAADVLRLVFSVSVAIFASPVILDFRLPSWPGFLPFMEKGFKDFTDRTVFAFHPHGAISFGFTAAETKRRSRGDAAARVHGVNGLFDSQFLEKSTKMTFLIDDFLRNGNPIFRLFCDVCLGFQSSILSADKSTVHRLMEEGGSVALVLGGFEEATVCETGKDRVVVKSRKGLVKYCLQPGASG
ncbi:Diacylglycerol O-acyltransferase 2 (Acyl-CoA retinol O-fatty-acyltransferase) (ARAT) (Retinol O-fatty-acyltransferase) (Diglyceride acyltransferase 2) [Durusdinium trenchii]|uniref:Diacylglycerol O-acyltransferase 2 (Acyl-CoA retinol O-fatty-acyltransferase) (ARAT) (Retinol O-fatty-acyltransferase) (Diglyceride acyltransferase 2) n=1 Tax=Durusdinium trenchii TaxID=1381693 RepID=A0ABP0RSG4_9DINO